MKKAEEYTRLVSQTYESIVNDYVAMTQRAEAAEARVKELEAHLASERITRDAVIQQGFELEARVKELEEDNARYGFCVTHLKRELANALEQGGAK